MDTLQLDHLKFLLHKSWGKKEVQMLCSQMLISEAVAIHFSAAHWTFR